MSLNSHRQSPTMKLKTRRMLKTKRRKNWRRSWRKCMTRLSKANTSKNQTVSKSIITIKTNLSQRSLRKSEFNSWMLKLKAIKATSANITTTKLKVSFKRYRLKVKNSTTEHLTTKKKKIMRSLKRKLNQTTLLPRSKTSKKKNQSLKISRISKTFMLRQL